MSKGYDWGGFLASDPGVGGNPFYPTTFGLQLLAVDGATGALSLIGAEGALGNPLVDGYLLSSTTAGLRSWVAPGTGTALPAQSGHSGSALSTDGSAAAWSSSLLLGRSGAGGTLGLKASNGNLTTLLPNSAGSNPDVTFPSTTGTLGLLSDITFLNLTGAPTDNTALASALAAKASLTGGTSGNLVESTGPTTLGDSGVALNSLAPKTAVYAADYGAVGDNSTDDTAHLQAAMDAVASRGTLILAAKTFKITAALTRTNAQGPIRILGSGGQYGGTVIHQVTANTRGIYITVNEAGLPSQDNACAIEHVVFKGPTGNTSGAGIYSDVSIHLDFVSTYNFYNGLELGAGCYFSHCSNSMFEGAANAGVYSVSQPDNNLHFQTCRFEANGYGAYIVNSGGDMERLSFDGGCTVELNTIAGLYLDGVRTVKISESYFEQQTAGADDIKLGVNYQCYDVTIDACWFTHYPGVALWHINANHVDGLTVRGSTLNDSDATGGDIKASVTNTTNIQLLNTHYTTVSGLPSAVRSFVTQSQGDGGGNGVGFLFANTYGGSTTSWGIGVDNTYGKGVNFAEVGVADGRLILKPGGTVGINNTAPAYTLDINGTTLTDGVKAVVGINNNVVAYGSSPSSGIHFATKYNSAGDLAGGGGLSITKENVIDGNTAYYLSLFTRPAAGGVTERVRIKSTGELQTQGSSTSTGLDLATNDNYAEMRVIRNSLNTGDQDMFVQFGAGTGSKLHLYSNNTETIKLDSGSVNLPGLTASTLLQLDSSKNITSLTPGTGVAAFLATPTSANLASALTDETGSGAAVFGTNPTLTGATIDSGSLILQGNQSAPAWLTNGIRFKGISGTLTDTTSATGTVAKAYTNKLGGNTIAATNSGVVFTDYMSGYFSEPVAGTNVTLTNKWALGADSLYVGTSNPFKVTSAGAVSANTLSIGAGSAITSSGAGGALGTGAFAAAGVTTTSPLSGTTALSLLTNVDFSFTAAQTLTLAPAANTVATGLLLTDTTAATSGNQQYSPAVRWTGQGWKTTATAASQAVDFRAYVVPVQGTANPSGYLTFDSAINGGSFLTLGTGLNLFSDGGAALGVTTSPGAGVLLVKNHIFFNDTTGSNSLQYDTHDANGILFSVNSQYAAKISSYGIRLKSSVGYLFSSNTAYGDAADAGLYRNAAAVVEINDGTAGHKGTLLLRGQTIASLPATPVAGMRATVTDGDSGLAWGATVVNSGSGATTYAVWYNNSNWTVMGK